MPRSVEGTTRPFGMNQVLIVTGEILSIDVYVKVN